MAPIYWIQFARNLCWHAVFFFLPLILADRGIDAGWRGAVLAAIPLGGVLFGALAGVLADRLSPRPVVIAGLALVAVLFAGLAGTRSAPLLLLLFVLGGIGVQLAQVGSEAYVLKRVLAGREGAGVSALLASGMVAMAIGLALGGLLLQRADAAWLAGSAALGYALLAGVLAPRLEALPPTPVARAAYAADLRRPRVLALLAVCVLTRLHWGAESASYAPFLREAYGLDRAQAGLYMAGPITVLAMVSAWTGPHLDRGAPRLRLMAVGALLAGAGHVAFTLPSTVWASFAWRCLHEAAEAVVLVTVMREVAALSPRERVGGPAGMVALAGNLASGLGALGASPLGARYGEALPNQVGGAAMMLGGLLVAALARRERLREEQAALGGST